MTLRIKILLGIVLANALVLALGLGFGGAIQTAPTVGLHSDWIEIEKPWLPAPKVVAKINLQEGQAQLQKAMDGAAEQVAKSAPALQCKRWGPFLVTEAERIAQALRGWPGTMQQRSKPMVTGYVVYIPPAVVATGLTLETLRARGVREMLVISNPGSLQGSISLGLFRDEPRAREHQEKMLALGVPGVAVRERLGPDRVFFELRGNASHMQALGRVFEQNPRSDLLPCDA